MRYSIGSTISSYRKKRGLNQLALAKALNDYDIHITNAAISAWEKGVSTPTATQLLAICEILEITDIYTEFIGPNSSNPFSLLNPDGIQRATDYIELLKESPRFSKPLTNVIPISSRIMKVSLLPTSAGTGEFMDDENFEEVEVFEPVPAKASFGVYINGDSMEPRFHTDELVWIEQTETLSSGDIGLFYYDGMTYFKKLLTNAKGVFLVSLNPKYKPIHIEEFSTLKIFGKLATE